MFPLTYCHGASRRARVSLVLEGLSRLVRNFGSVGFYFGLLTFLERRFESDTYKPLCTGISSRVGRPISRELPCVCIKTRCCRCGRRPAAFQAQPTTLHAIVSPATQSGRRANVLHEKKMRNKRWFEKITPRSYSYIFHARVLVDLSVLAQLGSFSPSPVVPCPLLGTCVVSPCTPSAQRYQLHHRNSYPSCPSSFSRWLSLLPPLRIFAVSCSTRGFVSATTR